MGDVNVKVRGKVQDPSIRVTNFEEVESPAKEIIDAEVDESDEESDEDFDDFEDSDDFDELGHYRGNSIGSVIIDKK